MRRLHSAQRRPASGVRRAAKKVFEPSKPMPEYSRLSKKVRKPMPAIHSCAEAVAAPSAARQASVQVRNDIGRYVCVGELAASKLGIILRNNYF